MLIAESSALVSWRWILIACLLACGLFTLAPVIQQPQSYHEFADQRVVWDVPNFWNVVSNVLFAAIGMLALGRLRGLTDRVLSVGLFLTCIGSAFYHWAPDDTRLVWDRLPMTLTFLPVLTWMLLDGRDWRWEPILLCTLNLFGIGSVLWWHMFNDLRPYLIVQFGPMLLLASVLLRVRSRWWLFGAVGLYLAAKVAESYDGLIYEAFVLSGHTIKHLLAAGTAYCIVQWRCEMLRQLKANADLTCRPAFI